jgi:hypothetical protein
MKHIFSGFNLIGAFTLLALALGCSSNRLAGILTLIFATAYEHQAIAIFSRANASFTAIERSLRS